MQSGPSVGLSVASQTLTRGVGFSVIVFASAVKSYMRGDKEVGNSTKELSPGEAVGRVKYAEPVRERRPSTYY